MSKSSPRYFDLFGGLPCVSWGGGKKTLLVLAGGPGNAVPKKLIIQNFYHEFDPFLEDYTLFLVSRKKGQPDGYTTRDMSEDYARMISHDFHGHVNLIVGISYGGMIAQHLAADHPDLFDHLVIALAAHRISPEGMEIDKKVAALLSRGRLRTAAAHMVQALYPANPLRVFYRAVFWLLGHQIIGAQHSTFSRDVVMEIQAEINHDASSSLGRIKAPVLIICGDADIYFPREYVIEMADLIRGSTLKLHPGKGHMSTLESKAFGREILEFVQAGKG
jgi:pimeloyl-ACP methyl ester carboxylesterase